MHVLSVMFLHRLEVRVLHGVARSNTLSVVVAQHLVQQVKSFFRDQLLVLRVDELLPGLARLLAQEVIVVAVQSHVILFNVSKELICAKHLGDLHELIIVVLALEEWLLLEDHACEHAAQRPNVQRVVVHLQVDQKLRSFEIAGSNSDIVLLARVIKLSETPVDQPELAAGVINHDVVGLHIAVHDAFAVAEIEGFEHFKDVVANVEVGKLLVKRSEVNVASLNVLHDQCGSLGHWVSHDINQIDDVHTVLKGLQNLDFSPDLGLLN